MTTTAIHIPTGLTCTVIDQYEDEMVVAGMGRDTVRVRSKDIRIVRFGRIDHLGGEDCYPSPEFMRWQRDNMRQLVAA
jgi:hypothetical protein